MELRNRWSEFAERLGLPSIFDRIEAVYARPPGWYHTLGHVESCLIELDGARSLADDPDAVELALWFHDAIYDPRAKDNEERSAGLMKEWLAHPLTEEASHLVLATQHAKTPKGRNAALTVDIDLSILGKPEDEFDTYEIQIRTEYAWVPEEKYRAGRSAALNSFLGRRFIYSTEPFRQRYEDQARKNLARSLANLRENSL